MSISKEDQLFIAKEIAKEVHKGQKRPFGKKEDYINHPKRIASRFSTIDSQIVAWLHDVLEDSELTWEDLIGRGISPHLALAVKILTKDNDETYLHYILRVRQDYQAKIIKIADLQDNLSDLRKGSMRDKYMLAMHILNSQLQP